jgi:hypothetical protein
VFTKKDGTERKLICTLAESKIPSEKVPKNAKKTQSKESIAVLMSKNKIGGHFVGTL